MALFQKDSTPLLEYVMIQLQMQICITKTSVLWKLIYNYNIQNLVTDFEKYILECGIRLQSMENSCPC